MNRRKFLGSILGLAGAAAVGDLPAFAGPTGDQAPTSWEGPVGKSISLLKDGQSIQAAIDALPSAGGTIYLSAGIYVVGQMIQIPKGVHLVATGSATFADCHVQAEEPIILAGKRNLIQNCYLEARGKLDHFFEVQTQHGTVSFGNLIMRLRDSIEAPFREVLELIREGV